MILERDSELEQLRQLLGDLDTSGGRVVLVRGEAGIGKSALLSEFMTASQDRAHVLFGACDDLLTPQALGPFWDIAREESSLVQPLAEGDRLGVLHSCLDLLSRSLRPTIMVIEDTHWADEATLDAITYLGRRIGRSNGLLLLTYRDGEVDYDHPLRAVIGELPPRIVDRIQLGGLSLAAVASILGDSGLNPQEVAAATSGNPFLVTEMASSRGDTIPASVQESVMPRVAKLSSETHDLLKALSVIPERITLSELQQLHGSAEDALAEAERRGLLHVGPDFVAFRHELIRRAIEASLTARESVAINRRVLEALPSGSDPARLVHHSRQAEDIDRLLEAAPEAGRAAAGVGAHREAVAHFRLLRGMVDRLGDDQGPFLDDWAEVEFVLDNTGRAIELTQRAIAHYRGLGDFGGESGALIKASHYCWIIGERERCEEFAEQALTALGASPSSWNLARALEINAFAEVHASNAPGASSFVDRAIAAADSDDEWMQIRILNLRGQIADLIDYPSGRANFEEAYRRAEGAGELYEESRALMNHSWGAIANCDLPIGADYAQRAIAAASRYQLVTMESYAKALLLTVHFLGGEFEKAETLARSLDLDVEAHRAAMYKAISIPVVGVLEARTGRHVLPELTLVWEAFRGINEFMRAGPIAAAIAEIAWISGDSDSASVADIRRIMEMGVDRGLGWMSGSIAFWLWMLGELAEVPEGIAEPYRLVIEGQSDAAAEAWGEMGLPYERALALMHGDEKAQQEALEIFETLGVSAIAAKLRKSMRDQGLTVPRGKSLKTRDHIAGLTARQAEVLDLLAEGLSNLEIADRLFVSPRTVENHVSAVLMKLDTANRDEAVETARGLGILATP